MRTKLFKIGDELIHVPLDIIQLNDNLSAMVSKISDTQIVTIINCDPAAFKVFLNFLSTGQVQYINLNVLVIAYKMKDYRLKKKCEDYLCKQINLQNAFEMIEVSLSYNCQTLMTKTTRYVVNNQVLSSEFHQSISQFIDRNKEAAMILLIAYSRTLLTSMKSNICHFLEMDEWMKDPKTDKNKEIVIHGYRWLVTLSRPFIGRRFNLSVRLTPLFENHFTVDIEVILRPKKHPCVNDSNSITIEKKNCIFDDRVRTVMLNIMKFSEFRRQCDVYIYLDDLMIEVNINALEREE